MINFQLSLKQYFPEASEQPIPKNLKEAFTLLIECLSRQQKQVVLIDKLPWITTAKYAMGDAKNKGTKIDLTFERDDQIINIREIKFYNKPFGITKDISESMNYSTQILQSVIKRKQSIHLTIVSTFGIKENKYNTQIQSEIILQDLFVRRT